MHLRAYEHMSTWADTDADAEQMSRWADANADADEPMMCYMFTFSKSSVSIKKCFDWMRPRPRMIKIKWTPVTAIADWDLLGRCEIDWNNGHFLWRWSYFPNNGMVLKISHITIHGFWWNQPSVTMVFLWFSNFRDQWLSMVTENITRGTTDPGIDSVTKN